jgi:hypothetical protein
VRWDRTAEDPFSRLVITLAGEAMDAIDGVELSEYSHDRAHVQKCADAYVRLYGGDPDSIIETAWQRALQFCRENESLIRHLGDRLARVETFSGLALQILLDRIDPNFSQPGKRKPRKTKDIYDDIDNDDDLDATMASQESEDIDEEMVAVESGAEEDEDTVETSLNQVETKKKRQQQVLKKAGRIGTEGFYRTDGRIGGCDITAGGPSMRSDWEPDEQALYERAVRWWSRGEVD